MTDRKRSRYFAYVDTATAEPCCTAGHDTAAEALQHAAERIRERQKERK